MPALLCLWPVSLSFLSFFGFLSFSFFSCIEQTSCVQNRKDQPALLQLRRFGGSVVHLLILLVMLFVLLVFALVCLQLLFCTQDITAVDTQGLACDAHATLCLNSANPSKCCFRTSKPKSLGMGQQGHAPASSELLESSSECLRLAIARQASYTQCNQSVASSLEGVQVYGTTICNTSRQVGADCTRGPKHTDLKE